MLSRGYDPCRSRKLLGGRDLSPTKSVLGVANKVRSLFPAPGREKAHARAEEEGEQHAR